VDEYYLYQLFQCLSPGQARQRGIARILAPQIRAYDALAGTKRLPEYVSCDVLARIRTMLLNQLMRTAGRAQSVGCWGNEVGA
jgi:hypothetical protein